MAKSEFMRWLRAELNESKNTPPTVPICPCAACFNGTGCVNTTSSITANENVRRQPRRDYASNLGVRGSESDLVPLCSVDTWSTRSSFDSCRKY